MKIRFRFCSMQQYEKLRDAWWTKVDSIWFSQENVRLRLFGTLIAYSQPDMLSDDIDSPDMCWKLSLSA